MKTMRFLATTIAAVMTALSASAMMFNALASERANGDEYFCNIDGGIYNDIDASLSETKPTLSLSRIELPLNEALENPVQTVELTVSGAEGKYCSTGLHIYYSDELSIVPFKNGRLAKSGDAVAYLATGTPREDVTAPEGYKGFFAATGGDQADSSDGVMWTFQVQLPENVQVGDTFPIELFYRNTGAGSTFRNSAVDEECAYMEKWVFTNGVEQGYITITEPTADEPEIVVNHEDKRLGDIDGDGKVNSADATKILSIYSELTTGGDPGLTEEQLKAADINKDGKINSVDATLALAYYSYTSTGGTLALADFIALGL